MTAFTRLVSSLQSAWTSQPLLRSINFHNTARVNAERIERQLAYCGENFSTVTEDDLDHYLATGAWEKSKPGMLLAFYEGYRNNYDVIVPSGCPRISRSLRIRCAP